MRRCICHLYFTINCIYIAGVFSYRFLLWSVAKETLIEKLVNLDWTRTWDRGNIVDRRRDVCDVNDFEQYHWWTLTAHESPLWRYTRGGMASTNVCRLGYTFGCRAIWHFASSGNLILAMWFASFDHVLVSYRHDRVTSKAPEGNPGHRTLLFYSAGTENPKVMWPNHTCPLFIHNVLGEASLEKSIREIFRNIESISRMVSLFINRL